ncbi:E3 ubiquitin-protein ligase PUB23-like [Curcuma longa]|uniref:E3 ubiquitin-protein ligase PUB23-like n=1 Tax=Curcuma longa TaxID=136217 RepID=UPI003D9E47F8
MEEEEAAAAAATAAEGAGVPLFFLCPISMELMRDPVTVATGVTYERKNIEKWLFVYNKSTCPATMQRLPSFHLTPNHTVSRLISSFITSFPSPPPPPTPFSDRRKVEQVDALLYSIRTGPFKATRLRELRSVLAGDANLLYDVNVSSKVLECVMAEIVNNADFVGFGACEEAFGVLAVLPLSDKATVDVVVKPEHLRPIMAVLQSGSADARVDAMSILVKISKANRDHWIPVDQEFDLFTALLELLSDEISSSTKLSLCSLDLLLELAARERRSRSRAVEAGAVRVLVELLPEAGRRSCERTLLLLKRLCELPEGRAAFAEHGLGVAAVAKKLLRVSETATKLGVKVLWLVSSFSAAGNVAEEMVVVGAVRKMVALLHAGGGSSTKERVIAMIKLHGGLWRRLPCVPCELTDFMRSNH